MLNSIITLWHMVGGKGGVDNCIILIAVAYWLHGWHRLRGLDSGNMTAGAASDGEAHGVCPEPTISKSLLTLGALTMCYSLGRVSPKP